MPVPFGRIKSTVDAIPCAAPVNDIGAEIFSPASHSSFYGINCLQPSVTFAKDQMIAPRDADDIAAFRCSHSNLKHKDTTHYLKNKN
jgi:hypothetical protein